MCYIFPQTTFNFTIFPQKFTERPPLSSFKVSVTGVTVIDVRSFFIKVRPTDIKTPFWTVW